MRCAICDRALSDQEVVWSSDTKAYEPCSTCLEAAFEAAYCDGFHREDPLEDLGMDEGYEKVELLEPDVDDPGSLSLCGYYDDENIAYE